MERDACINDCEVFRTVFQHYFSNIDAKNVHVSCSPGVTIFFSSHWLLSYITVIEILIKGERGMDPFAVGISNLRKKHKIDPLSPASVKLSSTDFPTRKGIRIPFFLSFFVLFII